MDESAEALRWRLMLIDTARQSLDIQYFFWFSDESGWLLMDRVMAAADRGVRVRILLDDVKLKPGLICRSAREHLCTKSVQDFGIGLGAQVENQLTRLEFIEQRLTQVSALITARQTQRR